MFTQQQMTLFIKKIVALTYLVIGFRNFLFIDFKDLNPMALLQL